MTRTSYITTQGTGPIPIENAATYIWYNLIQFQVKYA